MDSYETSGPFHIEGKQGISSSRNFLFQNKERSLKRRIRRMKSLHPWKSELSNLSLFAVPELLKIVTGSDVQEVWPLMLQSFEWYKVYREFWIGVWNKAIMA
jgi:hypothetical protein